MYRNKRNAEIKIYRKARYEQLKVAEVQLKAIQNGNASGDNNIQHLQLLANRRQQILEYGRQYARTYRQNHPQQPRRRWVSIQQVWDEDNPCRQVKCLNMKKLSCYFIMYFNLFLVIVEEFG